MNSEKIDPDHVYIDINVYNQPNDVDNAPQFLEYTEQRQSPILPTSSEEWYMSVVRFSLQTSSLPIWYPKIELNQNNPDKLVYVMTVKYHSDNGNIYTVSRHVKWYPENVTIPAPSPVGSVFVEQPFSEYYYAYSSQHIIRVFNATLRDIYEALYDICGIYGFPMRPDYVYQFFDLDANSRWVLNSDYELFNQNYLRTDRILPEPLKCACYINSSLYTLLSSFPCAKVNSGNTNQSYRFTITNNANANIANIPESGGAISTYRQYIQTFQEYDSSNLWCPIQSIVFKTTMIPVANTLTSPQQILNKVGSKTNSFLNSGNNSMTDNVLTDFQVHMENLSSYNGTIQYTPTSEYRLIDLIGSGNCQFNEINISAFWKDELGGLHKLFLDSACNFNIKILFRKKAFSNK